MEMRVITQYGLVLFGILLSFVASFPTYAAENTEDARSTAKAVVFLLDTSGSMQTNDPNGYALDGIAQLIYALPTNYEMGFVAYNTAVSASQPLVENHQREQVMKVAEAVEYKGYSNTGAGLEAAVGLLEGSKTAEKHIVLLSDGEFLMEDEEQTDLSRESYWKAVETAKTEGIHIHVIGLGEEMEDTTNSVFQAASYTEGGSWYTPRALEIQAAIDSLLMEQLGIKQVTAAIVETDGSVEEIFVELPFSYADKVRILLTGSAAIENLQTNFKAESANQRNGERYSLIELEAPQNDRIEISFMAEADNQVRITLIPEYEVAARAEVSYRDSEPIEEGAVAYNREAAITYTFFSKENEHIQLWVEEYFQHSKIELQEGDRKQEAALESGSITSRIPVIEAARIKTDFDCSLLPVNVLSISPIEIELEAAPLLPLEKPPYVLYIVLALTVLAILIVLFYKRKPKPEIIPEKDNRPAPGKACYVGNIRLYISRAPSGHDIEPLAYDLFRLPSTKVISFAEILESCGIKEEFSGAEGIYISSGQGRSIILTNQSDCCIIKSGEILMKQKSYQLFEDAKVDITFEDEVSELTFQYKVLKSGRMR